MASTPRSVCIVSAVLLATSATAGCGSGTTTAAPPQGTHGPQSRSTTSAPQSSTGNSTSNVRVLHGNGYTFAAPAGWSDVTAQAKGIQSAVDLAIAAPQTTGFRDNFNVVSPNPLRGATTNQLRHEAARELRSVTHSRVQPVPSRRFDGATGIGQQTHTSSSGYAITLLQYLIPHRHLVYATTLTFQTKHTAQARSWLRRIISSWKWTR